MKPIALEYAFRMQDGTRESFELTFDARTLELVVEPPAIPPDWVRLEFFKCPNCPLDVETHPYCPLVLGLSAIVGRFDSVLSYDEVDLEVTTLERRILQRTTVQRGISSLMGLMMATSGCPHTAFLRPMARFHLPLASEEETIYRAASMYMLAQYFRSSRGRSVDLGLDGLVARYDQVEVVNASVVKRLRAGTKTDSSINALINLDMYAKAVPDVIEESLENLRRLFATYLQNDIEDAET